MQIKVVLFKVTSCRLFPNIVEYILDSKFSEILQMKFFIRNKPFVTIFLINWKLYCQSLQSGNKICLSKLVVK